jgi:hypothetical protein
MKTIQGLKIAAMLPLAFMILVLLVFGIGEMVGGDLSGAGHLIPVVFVGLVIWFCWKKPLWGGILLLIGAGFEVFNFRDVFARPNPELWLAPLLIMTLPLAFSGLLLLLAEWIGRIRAVAPKKSTGRSNNP